MQKEVEAYLESKPLMIEKMQRQVYLVYIRTGGEVVAEILQQYLLGKDVHVALGGVTCRRTSTRLKKMPGLISGVLGAVIKRLPYNVLNLIRKLEFMYLQGRHSARELLDCRINWVELNAADYVLIVDDAVDSGYSFARVYQYVKDRAADSLIETFAVVVTQKKTAIVPNYSLFNNILIRFPWSMDFKE